MSIILKNVDYKELVKEMIENKILVDAIITDPPYCVSRTHQLGFSNMGRSGMNYGDWDYDFDTVEWIKLCGPVLKPSGSFIMFTDWKNLSYIVEELDRQKFSIKDLIRWEKNNPMPRNVNARYVSDFEVAIWAVKGNKKWTFNKPADVPYLRPLIKSGVVPGGKKRIHPTQKNLDIVEQLIRVHTNEGDLVFDPFSGSGTTAYGCAKNNRNFIGSEIDKTYYDKAVVRLNGNISVKLSGK